MKTVQGLKLVLGYLGIFLILIGFATALPLVFCFYEGEWACWLDFLIPAGVDIVLGLILYFAFIFRRKRGVFVHYQDSALLVLVWVAGILSQATPFFLPQFFGQGMEMSLTESIFETASGLSTTGLTIYRHYIDSYQAFCPHVYAFHRSITQFIGGVGFVLLLTSILGASSSMALFQTEGHNDRIIANLSKNAKIIFGIYIGYASIGTLALYLSGMPLFDAMCTSMCSVSGGGMSTRSSNIAFFRAYDGQVLPVSMSGVFGGNNYTYVSDVVPSLMKVNSLAIEAIVCVLVIFSAISFLLHTFFLTGKWKKFFKDDEIRFAISNFFLAFAISLFGALILVGQAHEGNMLYGARETLRRVAFFTIGAATNSGFSNAGLGDMLALGRPYFYCAIMLMLIGGGAGSCAGAIKQYRVVIMLKELWHSIIHRFAPSRFRYPKRIYRYGREVELNRETVHEAWTYALLFILLFILSNAVLAFAPGWSDGYNLVTIETNAFNIASAMSNTGLSSFDFLGYKAHLAEQGNNWAYNFYLWTLIFDMMLGRLEIMPFVYAIGNAKAEVVSLRNGRRQRRRARQLNSLEGQ